MTARQGWQGHAEVTVVGIIDGGDGGDWERKKWVVNAQIDCQHLLMIDLGVNDSIPVIPVGHSFHVIPGTIPPEWYNQFGRPLCQN